VWSEVGGLAHQRSLLARAVKVQNIKLKLMLPLPLSIVLESATALSLLRDLSAYPTPDRPRRGLKYRSSDLTDGRDHFFCSIGLAPPGEVAAGAVPVVGDFATGTTRFGFLASLLPRFPLLISISWTVLPAAVRGLTSVLYAAHLRVGALPPTRPGQFIISLPALHLLASAGLSTSCPSRTGICFPGLNDIRTVSSLSSSR
jgi:hypothetical protein